MILHESLLSHKRMSSFFQASNQKFANKATRGRRVLRPSTGSLVKIC